MQCHRICAMTGFSLLCVMGMAACAKQEIVQSATLPEENIVPSAQQVESATQSAEGMAFYQAYFEQAIHGIKDTYLAIGVPITHEQPVLRKEMITMRDATGWNWRCGISTGLSVKGRIRVDISSSTFPQYAIHSNYPGIWSETETAKTAIPTIHIGTETLSGPRIPIHKGE